MGSFYATCSITDLSLVGGSPTYMQLILPTWVTNPHSIDGEQVGCGEKGLRVSNEGAMAEFVPFGFPIEGEYYDYGDIEDIVRDRNVEMLEEFFNLKIDDIIGCATDDRWYRHSYKGDVEEKTKEEYKGQRDSWTIGDNKMKNLEILKQLTVTYFRKEHYDYLSEEFRGDDGYWMDESKKRLKKMKQGLKKLGEFNAKKPKKEIKKKITEEQVDKYKELFGKHDKGMSKEDIRLLLEAFHSNRGYDGLGLEHTFPIVSIAKVNMYKELPLSEKDYPQVEKQYKFMVNMHSLYKVLRPSYYGSQENNYGLYGKFHKFSTELASKEQVEYYKDDIGYYVSDALEHILDTTTFNKVQKKLNEALADKGIKF